MKYIDAEKLIAEIDARLHCNGAFDEVGDSSWHYDQGMVDAYKHLRKVVTTLQQEQESIAERFARIVRGNLIGIDKEVQQKFEQLYFEITGNKMYGGYND
jgi:hypothetical protein